MGSPLERKAVNDNTLAILIAVAAVWYFGFGPGRNGVASRERSAVSPTIKTVELGQPGGLTMDRVMPVEGEMRIYNKAGEKRYIGEGGVA